MERSEHRADHSDDVNGGPLSLVMMQGKPNRCIYPVRRAFAQSAVVVPDKGKASGQLVVLSMIVKMCVSPAETGSGPTISTWMCVNLLCGTDICSGWSLICLQLRQERAALAMERPMCGQQ
jgi:hypothetical protein